MLFSGNMSYPPNVDAAKQLVQEVLPRIKTPGVRVLIAGTDPTPDVRALAGEHVEVTGWMEDIRSAYARAALLSRRSNRNRSAEQILEAMAMELPCITTQHVASGFPKMDSAAPLHVANSPEGLARHVDRLLSDENESQTVRSLSRQWVEKHCDWSASTEKLTDTFVHSMSNETDSSVWPNRPQPLSRHPHPRHRAFINGSETEKAAFAAALGEAYETIGFAAIHGHGISDELIARLYSESEAFFALPAETKRQYARPETNNQRGFVSMGIEHAKDSEAADLKGILAGGTTPSSGQPRSLHFPSNDDVERPAFQQTAVATFEALEALGQTVLRAIAIHLGVDEFYFDDWVRGGNSILRAIHTHPSRLNRIRPFEPVSMRTST